jgi:hypothetical protein
MITAATINRELKKRGIAERIKQGRGYVYFTDGESHAWFSSSIAVCYVRDLVVNGDTAEDLDATIAKILRIRDSLINN